MSSSSFETASPAALSMDGSGDTSSLELDRRTLRRDLRRRRRTLSSRDQRLASRALCRRLQGLGELRRARRVALYLPNDGEIDPRPLIDWLRRKGARVYLPVLRPLVENRLWFVRYDAATRMTRNRFGIEEPDTRFGASRANRLPAWALDAVLMPLVGFDDAGNRIGMGGGFYDRTFAFARRRRPAPVLIGLAHDCQRVPALPVQHWDVPLDAIASDARIVRP